MLEIAEIDSVFLTHKNRLKAVPLDETIVARERECKRERERERERERPTPSPVLLKLGQRISNEIYQY